MSDFFISYTSADEQWAEWIAWTLEEAGYKVTLQKWDFSAGNNFPLEMQRATAAARRTIAVLSPDYLKSHFGQPEWAAAFAKDPEGMKRTLVPVRIRECSAEGLFGNIVYIDLVGLDEASARSTLLDRLKDVRGKPAAKPRFPAAGAASNEAGKPFPGRATAVEPAQASTDRYRPKIRGALTDLDKRQFMKSAFNVVRHRFEQSLIELGRDNAGVEVDFTPVDAAKFTAEVFVNGESRARCTIRQGGPLGADGISYAEGHAALSENSYNELLTLAGDGSELALRAMMNMGIGRATEGLNPACMSPEESAEYLWRRFLWVLE